MPARCNAQFAQIIKKHIENGLTNVEIARATSRPTSTIANIVKRELGGNPNYVKKHSKHKARGLYKLCLEYFLDHTFEQTMKKFKLTKSELKSVFTYAYRMPELAHIRKDRRRKDAWSLEETLTMIRLAGLVERKTIGKILNRSKNYQGIKDRLKLMNLKSRNVNGFTLSQYRELFDKEPKFSVMTKAGSGGPAGFKTRLIPWVSIDGRSLREQPDFIKKMIRSMTMFQLWIWQETSKKKCLKKILRQLK